MISAATSRTLNGLGLLAICAVLMVAFYDQFAGDDLPCPLCLLQRVGFVAVGFGLCLNVIYGPDPRHYGVVILGALFGGGVSVRQTLLHIVPGSGSYGDPFLGLHFYVWGVISFFLVIVGTAIMLIIDRSAGAGRSGAVPVRGGGFPMLAVWLMLALTAGNAVSTFLECGPGQCADDPESYRVIDELTGG